MTLLACGFLFAAMVAVFATSAHCESSPVLEWVRSILILTVGYMLGSLKVMQWFNVAVKAMWASRNHGGYSDLSHVFLNLEERSAWMNLGLWRPIRTSNNNEQSLNQGSTQEVDDSTSYPQACEALAVALGNAANIQPGHRILDAGFGRGEQLLVWLTKFKAGFVFGVNTSKDEVDYFLSRPKTGIDPERVEVELGSATSLPPDHSGTYDRVLALDCAYHFTPSRLIFFQEAFRVLKPGGVLALTDIVPISDMLQLSFLRRHALKLACGASGLPYTNLQHGTEAAYRDSLCRAGFVCWVHGLRCWSHADSPTFGIYTLGFKSNPSKYRIFRAPCSRDSIRGWSGIARNLSISAGHEALKERYDRYGALDGAAHRLMVVWLTLVCWWSLSVARAGKAAFSRAPRTVGDEHRCTAFHISHGNEGRR